MELSFDKYDIFGEKGYFFSLSLDVMDDRCLMVIIFSLGTPGLAIDFLKNGLKTPIIRRIGYFHKRLKGK